MSSDDKFDYIYSAPTEEERREIEDIKRQYEPEQKKEDDLEKLRALNKRVNRPPLIIGIISAVVGILIMGTGLTMVLEWKIIAWGIAVGISGIAITSLSYPLYKLLLKRNKKRYGGQIIELSNNLLNITE